jgi:hypothetical protein
MESNEIIDLINELAHLNDIAEDLWSFHPDNTEGIDVVKQYANIILQIKRIEEKLNPE